MLPLRGKKISTSGAAGSGRGLSREKSRFQVGYIPRNFKERRWRPWQTATEALVSALDRRKKALSDKLVEGNPGKRKLTVMEFTDTADLQGETMPPPRDYLAARQKNGKELLAVEVYERTWTWLHERGCAHLIPAQILEQYAMAISRWIQCEECITEYGFLAKHPTTGNAIPSPYVSMSQSFSKQANNLWFQIYQVVRENCSTEYKGATPHDDMMERLLSARRGG